MIRWLVAMLLWAFPVAAQVATVRSGEHDVFSRLVIEAPRIEGWELGRTDDGYELALQDGPWRFDMSGVFDLIPRNRLATIWADPSTGRLRLGIGCACHATAFEFRPGIVVIDLKDGPPPDASAFENALDGSAAGRLAARAAPRPRPRPALTTAGYNWLEARMGEAAAPVAPPSPPLADGAQSADPAALIPLRDALLSQLSQGMAQGVINQAEPGDRRPMAPNGQPEGKQFRLAANELPGYHAGLEDTSHRMLQPNGADCPTDAALMLQSWGHDGPASEALAMARSGLLVEFDQPDPVAVKRGAKLLLSLGFGAEAGQLLAAFPMPPDDAEGPLLRSLAILVDGESDPEGPFPAMAACDSSAALWAALASEGALAAPPLRTDAVVRGFSALPASLRQSLGPGLLDRLIVVGDAGAAEAVRKALSRMPGAAKPEVMVMEAEKALAEKRFSHAEQGATALLQEAGPSTAGALLALVRAQVAQSKPVSADTVLALEALYAERQTSEEALELREALVRARIAAGNAAGGFELLPQAPKATADAWRLLAALGSDSDVLAFGILPSSAPVPAVADDTARSMAKRLLGLGFADPAIAWMSRFKDKASEPDGRLAAQAELLRRDGRAAMAALTGQAGPEADSLRGDALALLGDATGAALAYAAAGDADRLAHFQARSEDWVALGTSPNELWRMAAQGLNDQRPELAAGKTGPLARSAALVAASGVDRAALVALLTDVAAPTQDQKPQANNQSSRFAP